MARRRVEVIDVVEVLVHWQAGRSIKQIARSTGLARNTVRKYLAAAGRAGVRRGSPMARAELAAMVERMCPELVCQPATTDLAEQLRGCQEEIVEGLKESTLATVWRRLRDAGRISCSVVSFRRFVRRELREVNPDRVVVRRPPAVLGECVEINFGVLGFWDETDFHEGRRRLDRTDSYSNQPGGGRGIRTPGGCYTTAVFKTAAINRTRPSLRWGQRREEVYRGARWGRRDGKQRRRRPSGRLRRLAVGVGVVVSARCRTSSRPRRATRPPPCRARR